MTASFRPVDFLIGMTAIGLLRAWGTDPAAVERRAGEIEALMGRRAEPEIGGAVPIPQYEVEAGYRLWAATYDVRGNFLIDVEEQAVFPMLDALPPGRVLDAACGTGRHARRLTELGHAVIGIDTSEAMLAMARQTAPEVEFRRGSLEALDLPDSSVDLVVCSLALTHVAELRPVIAEFARVLAPGGRVVLSDIHPFAAMLGGHAFFRSESGERGLVENRYHPLSSYMDAFQAAGLEIVRCIELPWDRATVEKHGAYALIPEGLTAALEGTPWVLAWELAG